MKKAYINAYLPNKKPIAFIVENDKFVATGSKSYILNKSYDEIIDLNDHIILPGINDSHLHLLGIGYTMDQFDLSTFKSKKALISHAKTIKENLLVGRGYHENQFEEKETLTKHDLNTISEAIPIIFIRVCGHMLVANDAAINEAKKHSNLPKDKDSYSLETGIFKEDAMDFIKTIIPKPTKEQIKKQILKAQDHLLENGITAIGSDDFVVYDLPFEIVLESLIELATTNELKLRVLEQANIPKIEDLKRFIDKGFANQSYNTLKMGPLKLLADGSLGARSAYVSEPYNDIDTTGIRVFSKDALSTLITTANNAKMDVAIHAIGDQMVEEIIDAIALIPEEERQDRRHSIIHGQLARYNQLERLKQENIAVQTQPIFINADIAIVDAALGERKNDAYLFKTMLKEGVITTISTDAPIESVNPFHNMYTAITRQSIKHPDLGVYNKSEQFTFDEALKAYTQTPAYFFYQENELGKIKPNHFADFIVVDNLDIKNVASLLATTVLKTYINGECVYTKKTL